MYILKDIKMELIKEKCYPQERALYESKHLHLKGCSFTGDEDGESALKESEYIKVEGCYFNLRYPLWHARNVEIDSCEMTDKCRAPLWYSFDTGIVNTKINGTKAVRECNTVSIKDCHIISDEFGWDTNHITVKSSYIEGAYLMSRAKGLRVVKLQMKGKYSFQYIENAIFENCTLDTKDAFWHAKNVTMKNSVVNGEYLGWYSENLTFENCVITGTQPLCYCKNLRLINCEMHGCDLAFEKSTVSAEITTPVISIKNVTSGTITAPSVDKIICDDTERYKGIIEIKKAEN